MPDLTLVALGEADIPGLTELTRRAQWRFTEADVAAMVAGGRFFGHRAADGDLASSAALFPYGDAMATVGMVIVSPDWQRRGLGRVLTEKCLAEWPHDDRPVALVSTEQGAPLYSTLGFKTIGHVLKMMGKSPMPGVAEGAAAGHEVRPMEATDREAVHALDRRAIGADRHGVLAAKIDQAKVAVIVRGKDGTVTGYGLGVEQPKQRVVGPIIAPDKRTAAALVGHLCEGYRGPVRIDIPEPQRAFRDVLEAQGFVLDDRPPLMLRGGDALPGERGLWFALAGQALG